MSQVDNRREEFFAHVWDHAADVFQTKFDQRRPLNRAELTALTLIVECIREGKTTAELSEKIRDLVQASKDDLMATLLQVCGLTRSKIISDLKASALVKKSGIKLPSGYDGLKSSPAWKYAGAYLAERLITVLQPVAVESNGIEAACEALNQATYPGFIRQERAKRQGHEADLG